MKKQIFVICTVVLSVIVSGCGAHQRLEPTSTVFISTHIKMPTLTESPRSPVITATSTMHPSLINCFTTPVSVSSEDVPNTPEAQEIIKTVQKSEEIYRRALVTSDLSEFPTVFINDPRFPVPPGTLDTVRRLSNQPSLQSAGWLDYKTAYITMQITERSSILYPYLVDTPKPFQTVPPDLVWCSDSLRYPELKFLSMNIDGDIATTVITEGGATYELTLVLVNAKWFIAAYKGISISS